MIEYVKDKIGNKAYALVLLAQKLQREDKAFYPVIEQAREAIEDYRMQCHEWTALMNEACARVASEYKRASTNTYRMRAGKDAVFNQCVNHVCDMLSLASTPVLIELAIRGATCGRS